MSADAVDATTSAASGGLRCRVCAEHGEGQLHGREEFGINQAGRLSQ